MSLAELGTVVTPFVYISFSPSQSNMNWFFLFYGTSTFESMGDRLMVFGLGKAVGLFSMDGINTFLLLGNVTLAIGNEKLRVIELSVTSLS